MRSAMATRGSKSLKPGDSCTEFQLHKSQNPLTYVKGIFDYSEFRLKRYIDQIVDEQQKLTLANVLKDYKAGLIAVAWKSGKPVWLKVIKEKS